MAYVLLLEKFGKKICSKQVVECDCKLPSLLSLMPMQSSRKRAQNNIATSPGEFQKLGTKRYQSDKLSFEFKIILLEMLILNSRTKSDSTAVPSECFSLRMRKEHQCLWDGTWAVPSPGATGGEAWAIRCDRECLAAAPVLHTRGRWFNECSVSVNSIRQSPGALLRMLKEGSPFCSELSLLCRVSAASASLSPRPRVWS